MRIYNAITPTQHWTRPFQNQGASVYLGTSPPLQYRNLRTENTGLHPLRMTADMTTTTRIASDTGSETDELSINADVSAYAGSTVYIDVRHFRDDVENETTHPQEVTIDGSGDGSQGILGTATLLETQQRAGGIVRFTFRWLASDYGVQPATFRLSRTAGPTSPADVDITADGTGFYDIDSPALSDAATYTFTVTAINGSDSATILTVASVQADATGPGAPTSVTTEIV